MVPNQVISVAGFGPGSLLSEEVIISAASLVMPTPSYVSSAVAYTVPDHGYVRVAFTSHLQLAASVITDQ